MTRSILELERSLHADQDAQRPTADRLVAIRHEGRGHRRRRRLATAGAGLAVAALVAGLGWTVGGLGETSEAGVDQTLDQPPPTELSPLAERALREVPGARQVSAYQVMLPDPNVPTEMDQPLDPARLAGEPVALSASSYTGVTLYPQGTFPEWLYTGVQKAERAEGSKEEGYPVGSFAEGIHVNEGTSWLACVTWEGGCTPTLLHRTGSDWYLDWGMGTDDFLQEGAPMEVFGGRDDFTTSRPTRFWIAGVDGEVARADFLLADGEVVQGEVAYDSVSPGDSLMWANVEGELAKVVAYGPDGAMVEDHPLRACSTPVECEVR